MRLSTIRSVGIMGLSGLDEVAACEDGRCSRCCFELAGMLAGSGSAGDPGSLDLSPFIELFIKLWSRQIMPGLLSQKKFKTELHYIFIYLFLLIMK